MFKVFPRAVSAPYESHRADRSIRLAAGGSASVGISYKSRGKGECLFLTIVARAAYVDDSRGMKEQNERGV